MKVSRSNLWKWAPLELLGINTTPLCLMVNPFSDIYLTNVEGAPFHVPHINFHPHWWLEKFREVWNQEVTWNEKLCPCLNCFTKWMRTCNVDQTLPYYLSNSNWTLPQKLWKVHVAALTKVKEWFLFKIQGLTLNESYSLVWVQQTLFLEHTLNQLGNKRTEARRLNLWLFSDLEIF